MSLDDLELPISLMSVNELRREAGEPGVNSHRNTERVLRFKPATFLLCGDNANYYTNVVALLVI